MEENKKEGNTRADQDQVATASESATTKVSENKQGGSSPHHKISEMP